EVATWAAGQAFQRHSGAGCIEPSRGARYRRQMKITQIAEGNNEINRRLMAWSPLGECLCRTSEVLHEVPREVQRDVRRDG
ncbi:MAG: hypothetical protein C4289_15535, partial [Chloroflexota bacterium]